MSGVRVVVNNDNRNNPNPLFPKEEHVCILFEAVVIEPAQFFPVFMAIFGGFHIVLLLVKLAIAVALSAPPYAHLLLISLEMLTKITIILVVVCFAWMPQPRPVNCVPYMVKYGFHLFCGFAFFIYLMIVVDFSDWFKFDLTHNVNDPITDRIKLLLWRFCRLPELEDEVMKKELYKTRGMLLVTGSLLTVMLEMLTFYNAFEYWRYLRIKRANEEEEMERARLLKLVPKPPQRERTALEIEVENMKMVHRQMCARMALAPNPVNTNQ